MLTCFVRPQVLHVPRKVIKQTTSVDSSKKGLMKKKKKVGTKGKR